MTAHLVGIRARHETRVVRLNGKVVVRPIGKSRHRCCQRIANVQGAGVDARSCAPRHNITGHAGTRAGIPGKRQTSCAGRARRQHQETHDGGQQCETEDKSLHASLHGWETTPRASEWRPTSPAVPAAIGGTRRRRERHQGILMKVEVSGVYKKPGWGLQETRHCEVHR